MSNNFPSALGKPNHALTVLTVLGLLFLGGGLIWVNAAIKQAENDATVESFTRAMAQDSGYYIGDWRDVTTNYTMAYVAGIVAVLGAIMLIAALTVRAARSRG